MRCIYLIQIIIFQNCFSQIGNLEPVINLLIDWAVSTQRSGNYRAVVVAKLVEKLQNEIRSEVKITH